MLGESVYRLCPWKEKTIRIRILGFSPADLRIAIKNLK